MSVETEEGYGYCAWFEGDQWVIEVTPPGGFSFQMPFLTKAGIDMTLMELVGQDYDSFAAAAGTPGLVG
jgi:hypothetical protein